MILFRSFRAMLVVFGVLGLVALGLWIDCRWLRWCVAEDVDPCSAKPDWIIDDCNESFIADCELQWEPVTCITISGDNAEISITWADGVIDILGDPNGYTEAARIFFQEVVGQVVGETALAWVRNDPNAIRQLAADGVLCRVLGHSWELVQIGFDAETVCRVCKLPWTVEVD